MLWAICAHLDNQAQRCKWSIAINSGVSLTFFYRVPRDFYIHRRSLCWTHLRPMAGCSFESRSMGAIHKIYRFHLLTWAVTMRICRCAK